MNEVMIKVWGLNPNGELTCKAQVFVSDFKEVGSALCNRMHSISVAIDFDYVVAELRPEGGATIVMCNPRYKTNV